MGIRRIQALDREKTQKYRIKKGQRELFKKRLQARMVALMASAYKQWENLALDHWQDGSGWRYLEGLYFATSGEYSDVQIKMKDGTIGSMLEAGYPSFNMFPAMLEAAFRRGGKVHIPMGDKGSYEGSVVDRKPIPDQNELLGIVQRNDKIPNRAIDALMSAIGNRGINSTAHGTKSLGKFRGGNPRFVTVSINKPADMWRVRDYRGAKIADSIAYFVEQNKESFFNDLFPTSTTVDF